MAADTPANYWRISEDELARALGSGPQGLSSQDARERLETFGRNEIEDASRISALRLLLRQFENPLVLILVFAACVSLALREWIDASIILVIVVGSCLLSFTQEHNASRAVEDLKKRLALTTRVLRDGAPRTIPFTEVVPGDVILLSAGNLIPADARVIEAQDFLVSEASMTGESFPVEKRPGLAEADAPLAQRLNCVFLGASVRSGTARAIAVATGARTQFGAIAARLAGHAPETEFARGVRQFGLLLVRVMVVIVLFVLTVNALMGRPAIESLLFAVALAVGLSPELLPAIISVTLSAGAREMATRGVIVRRLDALENLGGMDVLCTDKTGTLTTGETALARALDPLGRDSPQTLRLAYLNAALETGIENPLDAAIMAAGATHGLAAAGARKIDEIPYDFIRRRLTIVVQEQDDPARHLMITKGAFANVLEICGAIDADGGEAPLDEARRAELEAFVRKQGEDGFRVLALATRRFAAQADYAREDETGLTLRGFLVFEDPPKADAGRAIADLIARGVAVKIISGDNRYVTASIARRVGLDPEAMLTGEQMAQMRDEALWNLAPRTDLFVEIDPQQKERIVRALQRTGHTVGFLGDGVNDAPALHAADVGISVEGAVDVARESADIVLLQPDLDSLRIGVEDGRRTFANTMKYISITTSANFGNMVSMALATPILPFMPLAAKQILLNNFLSDAPSVAISTDNVDTEQLSKPQRWNVKEIRRFMVVFGLVSSLFDLITFATLLAVVNADEATFQTSWFVVSLLTELVVVLILRTRRPALKSRPSALLTGLTAVVCVAAVAAPYLGPLSAIFGFTPLTAAQMAACLAIVLGYAAATEFAKRRFYAPR